MADLPSTGTHSLSLGDGLGVRTYVRGGRTVPAQGVRDGGQTGTGQQADSHGSRGTCTTALHLPGPVASWAPGTWGPQPMRGPPPLQVTFDGSPDRVAIFLSQVISYMDLYGRFYPSQWAMVVAITTVLTGEAADWVADLHSDHARELTNVGMFLEGLRARCEDDSRTQQAEGELVSLR